MPITFTSRTGGSVTGPEMDSSLIQYDPATGLFVLGDGTVVSSAAGSAGATGGGSDEVFVENDQAVTTDYTLTAGKNAMSTGPITINTGVTVTIPAGATWVVL